MAFDERWIGIPFTIAFVAIAVAIVEVLFGALRQALRIQQRIDALAASPLAIDAEALERDLARIAASAVAVSVLTERLVAARVSVDAGIAEWRGAVQRMRLLVARAKALPEILS